MAIVDKLVIDASVLVAWFIPETQQQGSIARATIARFAEGAVELYAPAIMPVEVAAALVKATRRDGRKFTQKMAREALDQAEKIAFVIEGYPGTGREMMENAFRCSAAPTMACTSIWRNGWAVQWPRWIVACVKAASTPRLGSLRMISARACRAAPG